MPKSNVLPSVKALLLLLLVTVVAVLGILPVSAQQSSGPQGFYPNSNPDIAGEAPLKVMIPAPAVQQQLEAQRQTLKDRIPQLDMVRSFSPGVRPDVTGDFHTLAILVEFNVGTPNLHNGGVAATTFDNILFNSSNNSVRHFYGQNSYGQLDVITLNLPSSLGWIAAPQSYSSYVAGNNCFSSYPNNCQRLAEQVVERVDTLYPSLNWSQYDNDGDGYVDTVFLIHAGLGAEYTGSLNQIWSHSWSTTSGWRNTHTFDGVKIASYTTEPEYWSSPGDMTFGVYAHELGHALGLPDLYDIDYTSEGIGDWSLMSGGSWNGFTGVGGDSPSHFDAWSRLYLGFTDSTLIADGTSQTINLPDVETHSTNAIFRINTKRANEYFLLENRQQNGYDAALPSDGLLIWHVDDNLNSPVFGTTSNETECTQINNWLCQNSHFTVALEQADGFRDLDFGNDRGDSGDPFPGVFGNTLFNFTSNPNSSSYYSNLNQNISVSNISASQATMTALVETIAPDPANAAPLRNFFTTISPTLTWNRISWAIRYEVQVDDVSTFASPATFPTTNLNYTPTLSAGMWYWRVRACSTSVTCGPYSATEPLFIKP